MWPQFSCLMSVRVEEEEHLRGWQPLFWSDVVLPHTIPHYTVDLQLTHNIYPETVQTHAIYLRFLSVLWLCIWSLEKVKCIQYLEYKGLIYKEFAVYHFTGTVAQGYRGLNPPFAPWYPKSTLFRTCTELLRGDLQQHCLFCQLWAPHMADPVLGPVILLYRYTILESTVSIMNIICCLHSPSVNIIKVFPCSSLIGFSLLIVFVVFFIFILYMKYFTHYLITFTEGAQISNVCH